MALTTLPRDTTHEAIQATLAQDGAVIIQDVIDADLMRNLDRELSPLINQVSPGQDEFSGKKTKRVGALIARSSAVRALLVDPLVLATAKQFLKPFATKIQLHLTQVIHIMPGEVGQMLHRDRGAWGDYLPIEIEPQLNTIWALTDFTAENGATHVAIGSHTLALDQMVGTDDTVRAEMSAGSVLIYSGTVIHAGGANQSSQPRTGLNMTYCLGWLRTEENQFLSCPPEIARDLPEEITDLLGYTQGNYALGYYSDPYADGGLDILPPEAAIGRYLGRENTRS